MTDLPETIRQELEDLPQHYRAQHRRVMDEVLITARVRGVPVVLHLDAERYPFRVPGLALSPGWSWKRRGLGRGRKIRGLDCQERWNRTLGFVALLRELERHFSESPPVRRRGAPDDERADRPSALAILGARIRGLFRRLWPRSKVAERPVESPHRTPSAAGTATPEAIRAKYAEVIRDKSARAKRYQQAVAQLTTHWQEKASRLEGLRAEIRALEASERNAQAEARRAFEELQTAGKEMAEIRADPEYRRRLAAFEERSVALEELQERAEDLASEAEEYLEKVRLHETRLEELTEEIDDLKSEAEEMANDMTLAELEREVLDARAGISEAGAAVQDLEDLRRQLRKARAAVRVTREATEIEGEGEDEDEYLEAARRVDAARRFEDTVGLGESSERLEREDRPK